MRKRRYIIFFFNDTATTEIYTLSLHDALPICRHRPEDGDRGDRHDPAGEGGSEHRPLDPDVDRSEEHTSELQSRRELVCRLLLEKKKEKIVMGFTLCKDIIIRFRDL